MIYREITDNQLLNYLEDLFISGIIQITLVYKMHILLPADRAEVLSTILVLWNMQA